MRLTQKLLLYLLGLAATGAIAQDNWVLVTSSATKTYETRAGSLEHVLTDSQEPAVILLFRVTEVATRNITFVRHYVSIADCRAGLGKLGAADLSGHAIYDAFFVFDGGNVASKIAQTICISAALQDQEIPRNVAPTL
jgi:hypothetical protein